MVRLKMFSQIIYNRAQGVIKTLVTHFLVTFDKYHMIIIRFLNLEINL